VETSTQNIFADNLYERLGVSADATREEIKRAYHRLLRKYPPERAPEEFKRIREAYETLEDSHSREQYDTQPDPSVRQWLELGMEAMSAKRYDEAEQYFKRVLLQAPDLGFVRNHLGLCYCYQGKGAEAVQQYERLFRTEEPTAFLFGNAAHAYRIAGRFDDSIRAFTRAIEFGDEDSDGYYIGLADLYIEGGQNERARQLLERAIKSDGRVDFEDLRFFTKLLEIQLRERSLAGAQEVLDRIQGIVQDDEQSRYVAWKLGVLAQQLVEVQAFELAEPVARTAYRLENADPDYEGLVELIQRLCVGNYGAAQTLVRSHPSFGPRGWLKDLRPLVEKYCAEGRVSAGRNRAGGSPGIPNVYTIGDAPVSNPRAERIVSTLIGAFLLLILWWSFQSGGSARSDSAAPAASASIIDSASLASPPTERVADSPNTGTKDVARAQRGASNAPSRLPTRPTATPPVTARSFSNADPASYPTPMLATWIDQEKTRLTGIGRALRAERREIEQLSNRIRELKQRIRAMERDADAGLSADRTTYEQLLRQHNRLVDEHNAALERYDREYARYSDAVDQVNRLVVIHNSRRY
jgi:curved DNA-binding protein CbpA